MNLHALPALDEAPAPPAADAVARLLADARLSSESELLDAIESRRTQIALSLKALDLAAGLATGHASKCIGPARTKTPTLTTLYRLLDALQMSIVLVVDPAKASGASVPQRDAAKVRARGAISEAALDRARPHLLSELMRRANHRKWRGMPTPAFLKAMMESNP